MNPLAPALIALLAGFLLGRLTAPKPDRPPRWSVTRQGRTCLIYWTAAGPDGRTTFMPVPAGIRARPLARHLNRQGITPAGIEAVFGRAEGGRA